MDSDVAELAENIVNDLSKYSIVRFFYENPSFSGDLDSLARAIGLAPSAHFRCALADLVDAEIVATALAEDGSPVLVSSMSGARGEIVARMLALSPQSTAFSLLIRRLTARSLRQAVPQLGTDLLGGAT